MCIRHKLKVIDIFKNNINGSSKQFIICHEKSNYKINIKKIKSILKEEKKNENNIKKNNYEFF